MDGPGTWYMRYGVPMLWALQHDLQSSQPRDPFLGETPCNVAMALEVCK